MFKAFCEELTARIRVCMGEDYEIRMNHVVKNNGVELEGIVILKKEESSAPTIYVNDYFTQYQASRSMDSIVEELLQIIAREQKKSKLSLTGEQLSYEYMKTRIIYRLVNYEKNRLELENIPHIRYLDLAITFHCLVEQEKEEIGTIRIREEMMRQWQVEVADIWQVAKENTPKLFPIQIRNMNEVIAGIFKEKTGVIPEECSSMQPEMYIFTNESGINGASVLLYEDELSNFACSHDSDFYILPSSIHEVILIPYLKKFSRQKLNQMVNDVNRTQLPQEDILSDQVYTYQRSQNSIEM